jgi:hypothetical protein
VLAGVAVLLAPVPRRAWIAVGGMAALTGWAALSITWAPMKGPAVDDVERLVLYLAALIAATILLDRPLVVPALLAGTVIACLYGLSERLLPGVVHLTRSAAAGDRLSQPLTYWNAQGALAAVGLVLAAGLTVGDGPARSTRSRYVYRSTTAPQVLAAASMPFLGLDLYLTLSRGALGALVVGLLVLLALLPHGDVLRAGAVAVAATAIPALAAETVLRPVLHAQSSSAAGAGMLALLIVLSLAAVLVPGASVRIEWLRPAAVVALVAALAITILAAAHSGKAGAPTGTSRLTSVETNRYAYWRVALQTFADNPLKGVGTAGYRVEWLQRRHFAETVRDAHSLYLETLAELGIVGFAALGVLFGGVAARIRPQHAVAGAALAAWAVHAGVDWDWEMPALSLVAVLLAGSVLAQERPLGEVPAQGGDAAGQRQRDGRDDDERVEVQ